MFNFKDKEFAQDAVVSTPQIIFKEFYPDQLAIVIVIDIAYNLYSIDQLVSTHTKRK